MTRDFSPSALQRSEFHAKQRGHLMAPRPGIHNGFEDLQGLAAILHRVQSP